MKAFEINYNGIIAYYSANTRERARYLASIDIYNANFCSVGEALTRMKCKRAKWLDHVANKEGAIIITKDCELVNDDLSNVNLYCECKKECK